jgi:hypothetical protein
MKISAVAKEIAIFLSRCFGLFIASGFVATDLTIIGVNSVFSPEWTVWLPRNNDP